MMSTSGLTVALTTAFFDDGVEAFVMEHVIAQLGDANAAAEWEKS